MSAGAEKRQPIHLNVASLRPDREPEFTLVVKVVDAKPVLERPARPGARAQQVVECTIGDQTGCILFTARNDQADMMKPSTYVTLHNCKIEMFRGSMRVVLKQPLGKIEAAAGESFEPLVDYNLSFVEYELVQVPVPGEKTATADTPQEAAA